MVVSFKQRFECSVVYNYIIILCPFCERGSVNLVLHANTDFKIIKLATINEFKANITLNVNTHGKQISCSG